MLPFATICLMNKILYGSLIFTNAGIYKHHFGVGLHAQNSKKNRDSKSIRVQESNEASMVFASTLVPCNFLLLNETPPGSRRAERSPPETYLPMAHATPDFNGQRDLVLPKNHHGPRSLRDV